jgi:SGNH hydrolase-like domain, acetyltransferase AlgX/GDSL-like Lipase/Acylhydrolase
MTDPPSSRWRQLSLKLVTVAGGLLAALLILEILLHFLGPGHLYRSPDDMLATFDYRLGHGLYKPGRQGRMFVPFGDMVVTDRRTGPAIAEPRWVRYHIDAAGFRNDADYAGEKILLVGDSFVAGSGSTQEDLLSDQLQRDYGISAYNLGFPGELHSYVRYVESFFKTHQSGPKALIFLFEGNDFPLPNPGGAAPAKKNAPGPSSFEIARKEFQQSLKELLVYRYAFSLYHLLNHRLRPEAYPRVTVMTLEGSGHLSLGFLNSYMAVTERGYYDAGDDFFLKLARIKDHLGGIFFIPTKFRVYYSMVEGGPRTPLPNAQWHYVQATASRLGVRCVNLTGPLQEESRRLLPEGKLTYWKDDSHWNRYGMAVAAREVQAFLQNR